MSTYIHHIETLVPENYYPQDFAREFMKENVPGRPAVKRILHGIYANSAIEKRHSVIPDFHDDARPGIFFDHSKKTFLNPDTKTRNNFFTDHAKRMYCSLAENAVSNSDFEKNDITHVITVSCTGFFNPGPDYFIVRHLGLKPETRRYHIGFMGCYAAFPALKMAESICAENPDAVVLIATLELCTIHLKFEEDTDALISASVFADGSAAAIVSKKTPNPDRPAFRIGNMQTTLTDTGESDMAWTIGNNGFDMVLSTYVPEIINQNMESILSDIQPHSETPLGEIPNWAVHPGGRAILDKVEKGMKLPENALKSSRTVLRNFGNMSSSTILFVMKDLLGKETAETEPVIGMAFGPGLTVESGLFDLIPAKSGKTNAAREDDAVAVA